MDVELDEVMKDCLIAANDNYPDASVMDTVVIAVQDYVAITEHPLEIENEEEGEAYLYACARFVVDCLIFNMVEKGVVEIEGFEDGDFVYKVTAEF